MEFEVPYYIELILSITIVVFLLIYLTFSLVVIRQVQLLNKTLLTGLSPVLKVFSYLHALVALAVVFLAVLRVGK